MLHEPVFLRPFLHASSSLILPFATWTISCPGLHVQLGRHLEWVVSFELEFDVELGLAWQHELPDALARSGTRADVVLCSHAVAAAVSALADTHPALAQPLDIPTVSPKEKTH